jgi:hypothetical protein
MKLATWFFGSAAALVLLVSNSAFAYSTPGRCITQDTVRGGSIYNMTAEKCTATCRSYMNTAKPQAHVYACRFLVGKSDIELLGDREAVDSGECITQDTVRGGAQYPGRTADQCRNLCISYLASASPAAKVYDCRFISKGADIILLTGRGF